jgi:hypothetical protein
MARRFHAISKISRMIPACEMLTAGPDNVEEG